MGLKINRNAEIATKIVFFSLLGIIIIILAKIFIWEIGYYQNKTVETRTGEQAIITDLIDPETPIETEPTAKEMKEHKVGANSPRYITVAEKKSRIINIAIENNAMELPDNIHDVNWYSSTGKPGQGKTIMMAGTIDGTTEKGAFSGLLELKKGSIITIETGDGEEYSYSVTNIAKISRDEAKNTLPDIQIGNKNEEKLVLLSLTKTNAESTAADTIVVVQAKLK